MNYYLLTGATGLLGRYLLRYLLPRGFPLAVLVRGNRAATACQRLETIVTELEGHLGYALPRPVLLSGDLSSPSLGLSSEMLAWVKHNVRGVLHNAASLTFEDGPPDVEPWKTNLTGTAHLLEATRELGIREFHHVSTAYVCGRRHGVIREQDLDAGQAFGNDYERSKFQAEQLVNQATWLTSRTIYRPAIIVGDSQTGFSNTFHGFYTPLRIVHLLLNSGLPVPTQAASLVHILGLHGDERKNLVPVDWVSAVIGYLFTDPRHHGEVYHITPEEATPASALCEVMETAVLQYAAKHPRLIDATTQQAAGRSVLDFLASFRERMQVYQAYWRDDPQFDATHRLRHAPHLTCPIMDRDLLLKLCTFAIDVNFWWSKGDRVTTPFSASHWLHALPYENFDAPIYAADELLQLRILGPGGDDVTLRFDGDTPVAQSPGIRSDVHATATVTVNTLQALSQHQLDWPTAFQLGRIVLENCILTPQEVEHRLAALPYSQQQGAFTPEVAMA
jgi:thioester reductase-like protein